MTATPDHLTELEFDAAPHLDNEGREVAVAIGHCLQADLCSSTVDGWLVLDIETGRLAVEAVRQLIRAELARLGIHHPPLASPAPPEGGTDAGR